jgi:DNA-binding beta-propeller fold protein YncE
MSKIVVNPVTHIVYVFAGSEKGEGKVDPDTLTRGDAPFAAIVSAVNPQTNRLYGAAVSGSGVEVIDGSTEAVIATLPVASPGPIAVNPARNRVYVIDNSASPPTLKVFDGATNSQLGAMPLSAGDSSATMAVNSNTGAIYLVVNNAGVPSLFVLEDNL